MNQTSHCPNCEAPVSRQYCANCGQIQKDIRRFFLALVNEALEDIFSPNSRMWKTVYLLLFRPGLLTLEYLRGRRVSYVQPIRLYFITSIMFFVLLSIINFFSDPPTLSTTPEPTAQVEQSEAVGTDTDQDTAATSDEAAADNAAREGEAEFDEAVADFNAELDETETELDLPFVGEETESQLKEKFRQQLKKIAELSKEGNSSEVVSVVLEITPPVIFLLLPLFALLLKIVYIFRGVYYSEHLVYAVHNHCFIFLLLTLYSLAQVVLRNIAVADDILDMIIIIWIPLYLWKSLRNVYQQGRFWTLVKFLQLGISYFFLLGVAMTITVFVGILTI
ncbi:MAG: DUF3667 domain-containing protein [Pseudomonadota bacterium]